MVHTARDYFRESQDKIGTNGRPPSGSRDSRKARTSQGLVRLIRSAAAGRVLRVVPYPALPVRRARGSLARHLRQVLSRSLGLEERSTSSARDVCTRCDAQTRTKLS